MKVMFKKGIPGFEQLKSFIIRDLEENEKFKVLISNESDISFITINPFDVYEDYEIDLNDEIIKELEVEKPEDILILSIITIGKSLKESTMNLQAPLVINIVNNLGKQYIIQNGKYKTKHPLIRRDKKC